jgi:lysyl-tRNA synthetase class 2
MKTSGDTIGVLRRRLVPAVPTIFFWYFRLIAIVSILTWMSADFAEEFYGHRVLNWTVALAWYPSLPYGLLLLLLSVGVRRRKKIAWRILVLFYGLMFSVWTLWVLTPDDQSEPHARTVFHTYGPVVLAVVFGAALAALIAARNEFYTVPDRANRRLALMVFGVLVVIQGVVGTLLVTLTDTGNVGGWWRRPAYVVLQTVFGLRGKHLGVSVPVWTDTALGLMGSALLVLTAWALFKPGHSEPWLSPDEELNARRLLAEYGEQDSLGYFAVRRDKELIMSPNGKAGISYRVEGSVCLASGDPLGDTESWDGAIDAWLEECRRHAWIPAVVSCAEKAAQVYKRHGMDALELGDEAILDVRDFNLDGREMRQVRQAVRRIERAGYTVRIRRHSQIPADEMAELIVRADQWREGGPERGFSMALSRLGDPTDGNCVMVEAFDSSGRIRGMLSFVPWGRNGLSLDLMRRDREAENGLNEFMVAKLAENAGLVGCQRISLNFAMLRSVFERGSQIGAGPILRLFYGILSVASKFWQMESLYLANAKYHPMWLPRFVCFEQTRDVVRVGIAYAKAEGFLPTLRKPLLASSMPSPDLILEIEKIEQEAEARRAPHVRLSEQERVRHAKLDEIRAEGMDPYALGYPRTDFAADVRAHWGGLPPDSHTGVTVAIAGRIVLARELGRLIFVVLRDETGDIQIMLSADAIGEQSLRAWKKLIDLGDQVGVTGEVVTSRKGELSVLAASWQLTSKCLRPLPNKRTGLSDPEARVRQRYVDLIVNDEARRMIRLRGDAVAAVRDGLRSRGFLEVETPMLQPIHGGATARPFTTRINAYNMQMYLRIAPELYLKRLLVGGVGKVFELNRNFRNEGVDATHNPEFTMLEAYEPYGNYDTMAGLTRSLVIDAAKASLGSTVIVRNGEEYDFGQPWQEITVYQSVSDALGEEVTPDTPLSAVQAHATRAGLDFDPDWGQGKLVQELFEELVEGKLMFPTFVRDYPAETSPLTRPHRKDPRLAEKWDLIVFGTELGTAYSELIDPILQRQRLTEQSLLAAGGDAEAMELDEDFLRALEYAMPPAGGMGMGVDRLLITLTGRSIRETVAFPLVKPGG